MKHKKNFMGLFAIVILSSLIVSCYFCMNPASGFEIDPDSHDFAGVVVGSSGMQTFTITNNGKGMLIIKGVEIADLGSGTMQGEFLITDGWCGSFIKLKRGESHTMDVTFAPMTVGGKSAVMRLFFNGKVKFFDVSLYGTGICSLGIVSQSPLPFAVEEHPYSFSFEAAGGDGNYTYSVGNGILPPGLTLSPDGVLSGTPTQNGNYRFPIIVTDGLGNSTRECFAITVKWGQIERNPLDVDADYHFYLNETGSYTVNLINIGNYQVIVDDILLSGSGFRSGEAEITSAPATPFVLAPQDRFTVVIGITATTGNDKNVTLTVNHDGMNSPYVKNFAWAAKLPNLMGTDISGDKIILVLDRSGSMGAVCNNGFYSIYDRNGQLIPTPNRWQINQYITTEFIKQLGTEKSFDVVAYETNLYFLYGSLTPATDRTKQEAISWVFNHRAGGCTNCYDGLKAGHTSYGSVDAILYNADGNPNTAVSLGCGACRCGGWIGNRIIKDTNDWIRRQIGANPKFHLFVNQIGPPRDYMQRLGAKENSSFHQK